MKHLMITCLVLLTVCTGYAQAPDSFRYQAVARDASGAILANVALDVRVTIRETSVAGPAIYVEVHSVTTNGFGLFDLAIGAGTVGTGVFSTIDWGGDAHFLQIELDDGGGFLDMGTTALISVPYAMYANEAGNVITYTAGDGIAINGSTEIHNTGDRDSTNDITTTTVAGGDLGGTYPSPDVLQIQGIPVSSTAPANGQVMRSDGSQWLPGNDSVNTYTAGQGIGISGLQISNTGDLDSTNDITTTTAAGGDLFGTFPAPTVTGIQGRPVAPAAPSSSEVLKWNGTRWLPNPVVIAGNGIGLSGDSLTNTIWTEEAKPSKNIHRIHGDVGLGTSPVDYARFEIYDTTTTRRGLYVHKPVATDTTQALVVYARGLANGVYSVHDGGKGSAGHFYSSGDTNTSPALRVWNYTEGHAFAATTYDSANSSDVVSGLNYGLGSAGAFENTNAKDSAHTLSALGVGKHTTLGSKYTGTHSTGGAAEFEATNPLFNGFVTAIYSTNGIGSALFVGDSESKHAKSISTILVNSYNTAGALQILQSGTGMGLEILNQDSADENLVSFDNYGEGIGLSLSDYKRMKTAPALDVAYNGKAAASTFKHLGPSGPAAVFQIDSANADPVIMAIHEENGTAGFFLNTSSTADTATLHAEHHGLGTVAMLRAIHPANEEPLLLGESEALGSVAEFRQLNMSASKPAVLINNVGTKEGLFIVSSSSSFPAASIHNANSTSTAPTLNVTQDGKHEGGAFTITNTTNDEPAVHGLTKGTGSAGFFNIDNTSSSGRALEASTNGTGRAFSATKNGAAGGIAGYFENTTSSGRVAEFHATSTGNASDGVLISIKSTSAGAYALHANNTGAGKGILISGGGDVGGDFHITGTLTAGSKAFRIDHPLDPENKYLQHTNVESDEMMTIYSGNAILDQNGTAVITLPAWFEALNTDFRYQLTSIGAAQQVYISEEIQGNSFSIAGGNAGAKVSWQLTAVRHDAYAKAKPIVVELEKPDHLRGKYLQPDVVGLPEDQGIHAQNPR